MSRLKVPLQIENQLFFIPDQSISIFLDGVQDGLTTGVSRLNFVS